MKRTIKILALVLVAVILVCGISLLLEYTRTTSSDKAVTVTIRKGASEREIARVLKENGVIDYEITFRLKMKTSPYRGKLNYLDDYPCITMVGTRSCSERGFRLAYETAYDAASKGAVIINGLALGIDGACISGALDANGYAIS